MGLARVCRQARRQRGTRQRVGAHIRVMEEPLQVTPLGSVKVESVALDDQLDKAYKPGLFMQTKAFLDRDDRLFCSIDEQLRHCDLYDQMAGYKASI